MLRLGLLSGRSIAVARDRLLALGAVRGDSQVARALSGPGIVLSDVRDRERDLASQHLAVDVVGPRGSNPATTTRADVRIDGWRTEAELVALVDGLWHERLVPFEENLRTGRRAPRRRVPELVGPHAGWADDAARLIDRLHVAVGALALRIDHIGSTSVPGLRAKDLVDIQITVRSLDDASAAAEAARGAGFVHVPGAWFGADRFGGEHREEVAVDADPGRPTNVNCRSVAGPVWRDALLFRDWLRAQPDERLAYEAMKERLAGGGGVDVDRYSEDKMPWIRAGLARAEVWAAATGWVPALAPDRPSW